MNEAQLRQQMCEVGISIHGRGLTHGATGNISVRLDDGWLLTPTGSNLGNLDPDRLSRLDEDGNHMAGDKPTKESFLHLAVYDQRPGSGAVVHLHATYSVAVSVLADLDPADLLPPITAYYVMRVGKLPLVPFYAPGDMKLAEAVRGTASAHHAMLLANHGPVVAGSDLSAALDAAEELEETARLFMLLQGQRTRYLTDGQVAGVRAAFPNDV